MDDTEAVTAENSLSRGIRGLRVVKEHQCYQ